MSTIPMLSGPELAPAHGISPDSLVIFAHGYGSNGADLISLAPHFQNILPGAHFLSPNAPQPCPGAPQGYQWFPLTSISRAERDEGTAAAAAILDHYIDRQLDRFDLPANRLALVGFSQGTMMSLHVGLRRKQALAGIVGFSGSLASPGRLIEEMGPPPPVLLVHGAADDVVPVWLMFEAFGAMEAAKIPVERHISQNIAHSIAPDGLRKAVEFLKKHLA
ncbi:MULTISPECIES: alpha/beta fold hydrolase [unclassified Iodidimonas]|jgi:phospholipase/carboxylesterase|uniref:alpha/beta hydrolase n=1 Tax=unclassified Iodidimonas TaxID=2626145 RepID=UPI0024825F42|nr:MULTISPECIES: alpha/beta fold hydrolase [unclassified Iodidimonas]